MDRDNRMFLYVVLLVVLLILVPAICILGGYR